MLTKDKKYYLIKPKQLELVLEIQGDRRYDFEMRKKINQNNNIVVKDIDQGIQCQFIMLI